MKCTLSGPNARVVAKALQILSKFSVDVFVQTGQNGILFRTLNVSQSAECTIEFRSNFFTSIYAESNEDVSFNMIMKTCLKVFRNMKQVEKCEISTLLNQSKLHIKFDCRLETTKTNVLSIITEQDTIAQATIGDTLNTITGSQKLFSEIISYFSNCEELTFEAQSDCLSIKNYIEGSLVDDKFMRSQLVLKKNEFHEYNIQHETSITFCSKEFKAFLQFAECLNEDLVLNFNECGSPVYFQIKHDQISCNLIMSTLSLDDVTMCRDMTMNSRVMQVRRKNATNATESTIGEKLPRLNHTLAEDTTLSNTSHFIQPASATQDEQALANSSMLDAPLRDVFARCFESTYITRCPSPCNTNFVEDSDTEM